MTDFDTPRPFTAVITVPFGSVHLIASSRTDTTVAVNPTDRTNKLDGEAAEKTSMKFVDGRLIITTPKPRGLGSLVGVTKPGSVEMTIELPEGTDLEMDTGFADIRVDGRSGATRIRSGAGEVHLDKTGRASVSTGAGTLAITDVDGDADLSTAGEMRVGRITGDAEIKNLNGRTWVGEARGRLQVKSANGDIAIDHSHGETTAKTANGTITVGEARAGTVTLETGSGGIEIGIPAGETAWVEASTRFGRVHNSLEGTDRPDAPPTVEVQARTSFGNIVIGRPHQLGEA